AAEPAMAIIPRMSMSASVIDRRPVRRSNGKPRLPTRLRQSGHLDVAATDVWMVTLGGLEECGLGLLERAVGRDAQDHPPLRGAVAQSLVSRERLFGRAHAVAVDRADRL